MVAVDFMSWPLAHWTRGPLGTRQWLGVWYVSGKKWLLEPESTAAVHLGELAGSKQTGLLLNNFWQKMVVRLKQTCCGLAMRGAGAILPGLDVHKRATGVVIMGVGAGAKGAAAGGAVAMEAAAGRAAAVVPGVRKVGVLQLALIWAWRCAFCFCNVVMVASSVGSDAELLAVWMV